MAFVLPLLALLLSFLSFLSSVRFLFSRQGFVWIIPILLSLVLSYENLTSLLYYGEFASEFTLSSIVPFLVSFLWYITIIVFHYVMKNSIDTNKYKNESTKNRNEAIFMEKYERRKNIKLKKREKDNESLSSEIPSVPSFRDEEIDSDIKESNEKE